MFIFHFLQGVLRHSLTGDQCLARYVWDVFHVFLGRTFVFGVRTKKPLKTLKTEVFPALFSDAR